MPRTLNAKIKSEKLDDVGFILQHCARHKLLTFKEELELFDAYHKGLCDFATPEEKAASIRARQKLIDHNIRLAVRIAQKRAAKAPHINLADLIQEGVLGIQRAIEGFDPSKGYRFSTYAYRWIQQRIWESASQSNRTMKIPVHILEKANKAARVKARLESESGKTPTFNEIAEEMDLVDKQGNAQGYLVKRYFQMARLLISLDQNPIELEADEPESDGMEREDEHELIRVLVKDLPEDEQTAISLYFGLNGEKPNTSYSGIGRKLDPIRSAGEVESLINSGLSKLKSAMLDRAEEDDMGFQAYSGADPFEEKVKERAVQANRRGLEVAKNLVHVDSGDLKRSIELETSDQGGVTTVSIVAGSDEVDYAYHHEMLIAPFLRPAHEVVRQELKKMVG